MTKTNNMAVNTLNKIDHGNKNKQKLRWQSECVNKIDQGTSMIKILTECDNEKNTAS